MTDMNTNMMREVFKLLSKYENPPVGLDEAWWAGLTRGAAEIYNKYPSPLTRGLLYGLIDGQEERYKLALRVEAERQRVAGEQMQMDTTYGGTLS